MIDIVVPCECIAREIEHFVRCEATSTPALPEIAIEIDPDWEVTNPDFFSYQFFDESKNDDPLRDAFQEWYVDLMVGHDIKVTCNASASGDGDLDDEYVGDYGEIVEWGWFDRFWETNLGYADTTPFSGYQLAPIGCESKPIRERSTLDALHAHAMLRRVFERAPRVVNPSQLSLFDECEVLA